MTSRIKFNIAGKHTRPKPQGTLPDQPIVDLVPPIDHQNPAQYEKSDKRKSARSRLRLPMRDGNSLRRDHSRENPKTKLHKLLLYTSHTTTINDFPLGNSCSRSEALLPENEHEQNARGRSPKREPPSNEPAQESEMLSLMGFGNFSSTKGKLVPGNKGGTARRENATEYRQYMNRQKGFNRPLLPKRHQ